MAWFWYLAFGVFVLIVDRIGYWIWRRTRFEHARRTAEYPLSDSTNWRQPSNGNTRWPAA